MHCMFINYSKECDTSRLRCRRTQPFLACAGILRRRIIYLSRILTRTWERDEGRRVPAPVAVFGSQFASRSGTWLIKNSSLNFDVHIMRHSNLYPRKMASSVSWLFFFIISYQLKPFCGCWHHGVYS